MLFSHSFIFTSVERTLCPLLNTDPLTALDQLQVSLEVSSSSPTPVQFMLSSTLVENFNHKLVSRLL